MAMTFKTILARYLVVTGIAANLAVLGVLLLFAGDVASRLLFPPVELPAVSWETARSSLPAWSPATGEALAPGQIRLDGADVADLGTAAKKLRDGSVLEIGPGTYRSGLVIKADGVRVTGRGHVVFDGAAVQGKATFVVAGNDTVIENIECRNVAVRDRNGACVRLAGTNLTLDRVYFHDSEQGLLTGGKPGDVVVRHSFFERLGNRGRAHGIYQGGGTLLVEHSYLLAAKSQGHELKSRAERTTIRHSVVASLNGQDSRLIDLSNGGIVEISHCTLQQGPASVNGDAIGFALEKRRHAQNALTMRRNIIILERNGPNRLLHSKAEGVQPHLADNVIVSATDTGFDDGNTLYDSREEAGLPPYPALPAPPT